MNTKTEQARLSAVVAVNVRAEAARRGWTQMDMAERLGMGRTNLSDRYRGRTPWTLDETQKVADIFGVEVGDLLVRPKGFEPLTFWLGADGTVTMWLEHGTRWRGFCDECGDIATWSVADGTAADLVRQHLDTRHAGCWA